MHNRIDRESIKTSTTSSALPHILLIPGDTRKEHKDENTN